MNFFIFITCTYLYSGNNFYSGFATCIDCFVNSIRCIVVGKGKCTYAVLTASFTSSAGENVPSE